MLAAGLTHSAVPQGSGPALVLRPGDRIVLMGNALADRMQHAGYRLLAPILFRQVIGEPAPEGDFERLRLAVNDKNWQWHQRYRTVDGYNVYGGRSALAYRPDQGGFISDRQAPEPYISNYRVMQEEMSQRDVMTANRDRRVWAVAQGRDLVVEDTGLPPVTPVASNLPGPNPDRTHVYL